MSPPGGATTTDPTRGARRREGLLLIGYALLVLTGVWTVVVAELGAEQPASPHGQSVTATTQKSN